MQKKKDKVLNVTGKYPITVANEAYNVDAVANFIGIEPQNRHLH